MLLEENSSSESYIYLSFSSFEIHVDDPLSCSRRERSSKSNCTPIIVLDLTCTASLFYFSLKQPNLSCWKSLCWQSKFGIEELAGSSISGASDMLTRIPKPRHPFDATYHESVSFTSNSELDLDLEAVEIAARCGEILMVGKGDDPLADTDLVVSFLL